MQAVDDLGPLADSEIRALEALGSARALSQSSVAVEALLPAEDVARVLRHLEDLGYVERSSVLARPRLKLAELGTALAGLVATILGVLATVLVYGVVRDWRLDTAMVTVAALATVSAGTLALTASVALATVHRRSRYSFSDDEAEDLDLYSMTALGQSEARQLISTDHRA